ncbi:pantetheine-phosphate adenylyltransferase [bacterium]|nr:pantetheine-phosphate adenylyltransferase [bacterium]
MAQQIPTKHIAVYPGSFDPITVGHMEVAARASRLFGEVIVAIAADADKTHLFTLEERVTMATDACRDYDNIRVDCFEGLVVNYAHAQGAQVLVRGLRAVSDYEREIQMAVMNRELAPEIDTLYFAATSAYTFLSSSLVKHVHSLGGDVSRFVTPLVLSMLDKKLVPSRHD